MAYGDLWEAGTGERRLPRRDRWEFRNQCETTRENVVPQEYTDHKTSGLTETVERGKNSFTLELMDG